MKFYIEDQICPLCESAGAREFHRDKRREYFICRVCDLVFVPARQLASAEAEKARYDLHQNSPSDTRYRRFLSRILIPMLDCLEPRSQGLDFGSGPVPVLSLMFEEAGHSMTIHDIFYAPDFSALKKKYDFITASEVAEHLRDPQKELRRLWSILKPGGKLGIMTKLVANRKAFANWHYKNDFTHARFFSRTTFQWLAEQWKAGLNFFGADVMIFHKPE